MKQNITLSMDQELLKRLRIIAAQRSSSISRMLTDELTAMIERNDRYEQAKRQALTDLSEDFHFGGARPYRDELHER